MTTRDCLENSVNTIDGGFRNGHDFVDLSNPEHTRTLLKERLQTPSTKALHTIELFDSQSDTKKIGDNPFDGQNMKTPGDRGSIKDDHLWPGKEREKRDNVHDGGSERGDADRELEHTLKQILLMEQQYFSLLLKMVYQLMDKLSPAALNASSLANRPTSIRDGRVEGAQERFSRGPTSASNVGDTGIGYPMAEGRTSGTTRDTTTYRSDRSGSFNILPTNNPKDGQMLAAVDGVPEYANWHQEQFIFGKSAPPSWWFKPIKTDVQLSRLDLPALQDTGPDFVTLLDLRNFPKEKLQEVDLYKIGDWDHKSNGTQYLRKITIPRDLVIPDSNLNSGMTVIQPNGEIIDLNAFVRPEAGNNKAWGVDDAGAHGATRTQGWGSINAEEMAALAHGQPINKTLQLTLPGRLLSSLDGGYEYPAMSADQYYMNQYFGNNPALKMGTLLTFDPLLTADHLELESKYGRGLFETIKTMGVVPVDDAGYDGYRLSMTYDAPQSYATVTGYELFSNGWGANASPENRDMQKIFTHLMAVVSDPYSEK